jgi:hypothetical protein
MSNIDEAGFLSDQIIEIVQQFHKDHAALITTYKDLGSVAHDHKFTLAPPVDDAYLKTSAILFIRTLSLYEAIFLCAERGMSGETRILLRSQYDIVFTITALAKDPSLLGELLNHENRENIKALQKQRDISTDPEIKLVCEAALAKFPTLEKSKRITRREIAERAGLNEYYDTQFNLFSGDVHGSLGTLSRAHLPLSDAEDSPEIKWGPDYTDIPVLLLDSMKLLLEILKRTSAIWKREIPESLGSFETRISNLPEYTNLVCEMQKANSPTRTQGESRLF